MSNDAAILAEYVEGETKDNRKAATFGIIMYVILIVVIFAYFYWMKSMLREVLEPVSLAKTVVAQVDSNIPHATEALEENVKAALPKIVKHTMDTVVGESLPRLRKYGQDYLEKQAGSIAEFTSMIGDESFVAAAKAKRNELAGKMPEGMEPNKEKIVAALKVWAKLEIKSELSHRMEQEISAAQAGRLDEESAAYKLYRSQLALRNINAKLVALADGEGLDRRDEISKRIIGAWWGWLRKSERANTSVPEGPNK